MEPGVLVTAAAAALMLLLALLALVHALVTLEKSRRRRQHSSSVSSWAAVRAAPAVVRKAEEGTAFRVIGDWGRRGSFLQREVAAAMSKCALDNRARFTVSVGDNFYSSGVQSVHDSHWRESCESVYYSQFLQHPWYVALGNHDHRGNVQAQVDYTRHSSRWRMPSAYFAFSQPAADFFVLDTCELDDTQLAWLDAELGSSTAPVKFVVGHHPIYSASRERHDPETAALRAHVLPMLQRHGVLAYMNGHDHNLQHLRVEEGGLNGGGGVHLLCSGAGSSARTAGQRPDAQPCDVLFYEDREPGFMLVQIMEGGDVRVAFMDRKNRLLYETMLR